MRVSCVVRLELCYIFCSNLSFFFLLLEPPTMYIPLKTLAEMFATENIWQVINSAISGLPMKEDLVRIHDMGRLGENGRYVLQVLLNCFFSLPLQSLIFVQLFEQRELLLLLKFFLCCSNCIVC